MAGPVRRYLHSSSWDTRIAASQAVEAIISHVPQWDPPGLPKWRRKSRLFDGIEKTERTCARRLDISSSTGSLLVLDQTPIHKTQAGTNAFEEYDTDVLYVLAGCTSILQPADVYWNKPFESTLQRLWEQYMREEARTPKGNLKKPSRQHVLDFVAEAWAAVPEETVARSFKGCGISDVLDGSEDCDLHSGLADVGAVVPKERGGLQAECCGLFFATDSEESFDGFQSD
ncbi:hypothetical protein HPB52_007281 [Rhipicephalus sanguineus]|uniref:DDE-1 domain-containing protein n=1 Tax=Rhipicephalus sanguineus TaxID=34632 RepID=A0A9D4PIF7_RHISA|nr:hypothetical protein HPB52_007281 [Rhipicephalus sanguineus]